METPHAHAGTAGPFPDTWTSVNCSSHIIQENGIRLRSIEEYLSNWGLAPGAGKPPKESFIFVSLLLRHFSSHSFTCSFSLISLRFFFVLEIPTSLAARKLCNVYSIGVWLQLRQGYCLERATDACCYTISTLFTSRTGISELCAGTGKTWPILELLKCQHRHPCRAVI